MEQEKNTLTVLEIAPGQYPKQVEIDPDLKALQQAVGGNIGASYPFSDPVAIVYNDEGKLMGLPLNRALRDEDGEIYDAIAGTFFICGALADSENFTSLTDEQVAYWLRRFAKPEFFVNVNGQIICVPVEEPCQ